MRHYVYAIDLLSKTIFRLQLAGYAKGVVLPDLLGQIVVVLHFVILVVEYSIL